MEVSAAVWPEAFALVFISDQIEVGAKLAQKIESITVATSHGHGVSGGRERSERRRAQHDRW